MITFGRPERRVWETNGVELETIRLPILNNDVEIGWHEIWLDLAVGEDNIVDLAIGSASRVFGPLGPEQLRQMGFNTDLIEKARRKE